jgi:hypothetical protein
MKRCNTHLIEFDIKTPPRWDSGGVFVLGESYRISISKFDPGGLFEITDELEAGVSPVVQSLEFGEGTSPDSVMAEVIVVV